MKNRKKHDLRVSPVIASALLRIGSGVMPGPIYMLKANRNNANLYKQCICACKNFSQSTGWEKSTKWFHQIIIKELRNPYNSKKSLK